MATKKKATKTKPIRTETFDPKLMVINTNTYYNPKRRHISISERNPRPVCHEYGYNWTASTSRKTQELALCKKCVSAVVKLNTALQNDWGYVDRDTLVNNTKNEFLALLADLEQD